MNQNSFSVRPPYRSAILGWLMGALLMAMTACAPKPILLPTALVPLPVADFPLIADHHDFEHLSDSIENSVLYLRRLPADQQIRFGRDQYTVAHLIRSLEIFSEWIAQHPSSEQLNQMVRQRYTIYQASGRSPDHTVLFTGYYEPIVAGSPVFTDEFPIPLHSRPSDWIEIDLSPFSSDLRGRRITGRYTGRTVEPYPTRSAIGRQADFNRIAPPVAWVRDEIDRFNLQVQGSGKVVIKDGQEIPIQFDGSNGHPYRSIGRLLIDQGKISADTMSMQAIRTYLRDHPDQVDAILNHNPRYIFFRLANHGPRGALGVPLTAGRSIAVDRDLFPLGALAFITARMPVVDDNGCITQWAEYSGLALAQDTGSAIIGPGRADFFWGGGLPAEVAAGHLKSDGQLYFLVLKTDPSVPQNEHIQFNSKMLSSEYPLDTLDNPGERP